MQMINPNKRGRAQRSTDRNTRYSTHVPVLKSCIEKLAETSPDGVQAIEHGMGLSSTSFFHEHPMVVSITSLEREPEWASCVTCCSGTTKPHSILVTSDDRVIEQATQQIVDGIIKPRTTIGLVDGFASQRLEVLRAWMAAGVAIIVEHDAETFTDIDIAVRRRLARAHGYRALQFAKCDPETALYVNDKMPQVPIEGTCVGL